MKQFLSTRFFQNWQYSIKVYAMAFIMLYCLVFTLSAVIAFKEIHAIKITAQQRNYQQAHAELTESIQLLIQNNQKYTRAFADWDEVRQQLINPQYYTYWKTHRLYTSRLLPDYFREVALYNNKGEILGDFSASLLPEKLMEKQAHAYFYVTKNKLSLITIVPVNSKHNKTLLGFVATRSAVLAPLLKVRQFTYIVSQSIQLKTHAKNKDKNFIAPENLIQYLNFSIRENKELKIILQHIDLVMIRNTLMVIMFALLFYFLLNYFLSRPLRKISNYIDTLKNQPEFQNVPRLNIHCIISELQKVMDSLTRYQQKLQQVYASLDDKNRQLWNMAHHDALTGVLNRRAFEDRWTKVAELFMDSRCPVSLILFDINHFKSINDTYGHQVGDAVLKRFCLAVQQSLRQEEKLYRLGGDEFACILMNLQPEQALNAAKRCELAISETDFSDLGIKEKVRSSIGIAHSDSNHPDDIASLLWKADVAVYHAKRPGQGHLVAYSDKIKPTSSLSLISNQLNDAIFTAIEKGKGICMHYQPVIDLQTGKITYYEALLRIKAQGKMIAPSEIFEWVESKKLEVEMDFAILQQITHNIKNKLIPENTGISINISGPSIIHPQICQHLQPLVSYLQQYKIILEITETSLITNIELATRHIEQLRTDGFLIALDDFGSGYSSISYLSSMPVDIVKFDISLIRLLANEKQQRMIKYLAMMIKETGHQLVAEGIENETINHQVKILGFDYGQGYLYGKAQSKIS